MDHSHFAVLLLLLGLALLVAEIFIPSGGMILVVAILSLVGSIWCAWTAWGRSSPGLWWSYVAAVVILLPVAVIGGLYVFPRTGFGRKILLEAPSLDEVTPYAEEEKYLSQLIGQFGKTLTLLNPGGFVQIDDERVHCESEGMMIDPGTDVRVVGVKGNRLVVRAGRPDAEPSGTNPLELDETDEPPLDFEVPQS